MLKELGFKALERHQSVPVPVMRVLLGRVLEGTHVAVCLHRVDDGSRGASTAMETVIHPNELDQLLGILVASRPSAATPWLMVCFDDGYADAAEYVESRLSRFPDLKWLFFVCPEKLKKRAGFRWDLKPNPAGVDVMAPPFDVHRENDRADLRALGDRADCRLMTIEECRKIALHPNVTLGNHTNCHFKQTQISLDDARHDMEASRREFEELFGRTDHFAFPFGTPQKEFADEHVRLARGIGYKYVWSVDRRPYFPEEQGVLPRYPIFGTWPATKTALAILLQAAKWRWRSRGGDTPPEVKSLRALAGSELDADGNNMEGR
ncbi:MAG TPA: polysaccharide deacetylase family protein [Polyangiaceae bacterium]|jgi:peptidoglycan/xylan/chitin deacetylase (PgdA/CDA1 family)|nr:polysaccharide deacetylase family protein [Polyangiaceae bacterium]